MNCRRARAWMEAYLMNDLHPELAEQLERHLETCRSCQAACEELRRLIELLRHAFALKRQSA
jgi:anti-sigma factor RsiW